MPSMAWHLQTYKRAPTKTITFTGAAGLGGAASDTTIWTTTGRVLVVYIGAFCTDGLTEGGATAVITLGAIGNLTGIIGATNSVNIDTGEWWSDSTPTIGMEVAPASGNYFLISADIAARTTTQDTDGGTLVFDAWYLPLTDGASLT